MTMLQPHGVVHLGLQLGQAGTQLERSNVFRQEVEQHHNQRPALVRLEFDALHHRLVGSQQRRDLLPVTTLASRGIGQQHQPVMGVGLHNHLVLSPPVPLTGGEGCDVCDWTLGPEKEAVGIEIGQAPLG
jgi:hypothetical protein